MSELMRSPAEIRAKLAEILIRVQEMEQEWGLNEPNFVEETGMVRFAKWVLKEGEEI